MLHDDAAPNAWPALETAQSTLIGLIALTAAVAPLGLPPMVVLLAAITLAEDRGRDWRPTVLARSIAGNRAVMAALALAVLALLSTAWAARPLYSLKSLLQVLLTGLSAWYAAAYLYRRLSAIGPVRRTRFTRALPISALVIGMYFLLDQVTGDGVTLYFARDFPALFDGFENSLVYNANRVPIRLHDIFFNRSAAALAMLILGLVAALRFWPHARWGATLGTAAVLGLVAICLKSGSTTALLTVAAASVAFALALWSARTAMRTLQATFLAATIAAIPLAMVPKMLNLDKNMSIPLSFRDRAVIWNDLAHLTLERPWLGTGVKSVRFSHSWDPVVQANANTINPHRTYAHPHNGYLQIWLELGAFGALLFSIAGTLLIGQTARLPQAMQTYALAMAAATMAMIGPGWGLWQPWLIAAIGFGWIVLMMLHAEFARADAA